MSKSTLDRIFSKFIRLRDTDESGTGKCISCGKFISYHNSHNGHYVNRKHMSLRFDEKNTNMQCVECNSFDEGNVLGYTQGLIRKYGEGIIQELIIKKNQISKYSKFEYKVLQAHYRNECKKLLKNKNFTIKI